VSVAEYPALLPGALVHRRQLTEVLLTAIERTSETTFSAGVHWPRRHPYFGPYGPEDVDVTPALALETLRQAAIALAHIHLNVPLGYAFLMESMHVEIVGGARRSAAQPGNHTVDIEVSDLVERRGIAATYGSLLTIRDGDTVLARGGGGARAIPAPVYRRSREGAPSSSEPERLAPRPAPASAALVGAPGPDFVLVTGQAGGDRYQLSLDVDNPVYFDHPLDHVPGMVVLEAALQAFRARAAEPTLTPDSVTVDFARHTELTQPVVIDVVAADGEAVATFTQNGSVNSRVRASRFRQSGA